MKRLLVLFALLLAIGTSAMAQKSDALRLTLKSEAGQPVELLFTSKPVITYSDDHKSIILNHEGGEAMTCALADIVNMTFFYSDGKLNKIEEAFADDTETASKGTYTLDGKRIDAITAPGTYIINGKKVLVK